VDHCGNDGNVLPSRAIFILFTVHYYFDTWIQMLIKSCVNHYFSLSFVRKKTLKKYVDMFLACQQSKVTIELDFYYSNLKNAVETAKIAVDSCYVLRQFLTPLPSIDFREIWGLAAKPGLKIFWDLDAKDPPLFSAIYNISYHWDRLKTTVFHITTTPAYQHWHGTICG
jgi:hypothetical protein